MLRSHALPDAVKAAIHSCPSKVAGVCGESGFCWCLCRNDLYFWRYEQGAGARVRKLILSIPGGAAASGQRVFVKVFAQPDSAAITVVCATSRGEVFHWLDATVTPEPGSVRLALGPTSDAEIVRAFDARPAKYGPESGFVAAVGTYDGTISFLHCTQTHIATRNFPEQLIKQEEPQGLLERVIRQGKQVYDEAFDPLHKVRSRVPSGMPAVGIELVHQEGHRWSIFMLTSSTVECWQASLSAKGGHHLLFRYNLLPGMQHSGLDCSATTALAMATSPDATTLPVLTATVQPGSDTARLVLHLLQLHKISYPSPQACHVLPLNGPMVELAVTSAFWAARGAAGDRDARLEVCITLSCGPQACTSKPFAAGAHHTLDMESRFLFYHYDAEVLVTCWAVDQGRPCEKLGEAGLSGATLRRDGEQGQVFRPRLTLADEQGAVGGEVHLRCMLPQPVTNVSMALSCSNEVQHLLVQTSEMSDAGLTQWSTRGTAAKTAPLAGPTRMLERGTAVLASSSDRQRGTWVAFTALFGVVEVSWDLAEAGLAAQPVGTVPELLEGAVAQLAGGAMVSGLAWQLDQLGAFAEAAGGAGAVARFAQTVVDALPKQWGAQHHTSLATQQQQVGLKVQRMALLFESLHRSGSLPRFRNPDLHLLYESALRLAAIQGLLQYEQELLGGDAGADSLDTSSMAGGRPALLLQQVLESAGQRLEAVAQLPAVAEEAGGSLWRQHLRERVLSTPSASLLALVQEVEARCPAEMSADGAPPDLEQVEVYAGMFQACLHAADARHRELFMRYAHTHAPAAPPAQPADLWAPWRYAAATLSALTALMRAASKHRAAQSARLAPPPGDRTWGPRSELPEACGVLHLAAELMLQAYAGALTMAPNREVVTQLLAQYAQVRDEALDGLLQDAAACCATFEPGQRLLAAVELLAASHHGYRQLFEVCELRRARAAAAGDRAAAQQARTHLCTYMSSLPPAEGAAAQDTCAFAVFQQLLREDRHAELLTLPPEFNPQLAEFLSPLPHLSWLHSVRMQRPQAGAELTLELASCSGELSDAATLCWAMQFSRQPAAVLATSRRMASLSKIATLAACDAEPSRLLPCLAGVQDKPQLAQELARRDGMILRAGVQAAVQGSPDRVMDAGSLIQRALDLPEQPSGAVLALRVFATCDHLFLREHEQQWQKAWQTVLASCDWEALATDCRGIADGPARSQLLKHAPLYPALSACLAAPSASMLASLPSESVALAAQDPSFLLQKAKEEVWRTAPADEATRNLVQSVISYVVDEGARPPMAAFLPQFDPRTHGMAVDAPAGRCYVPAGGGQEPPAERGPHGMAMAMDVS